MARPKRLQPVQRARLFVGVVAVATTCAKLRLAATTFGTGDVSRFQLWASYIHRLGPIDIYSIHFRGLKGPYDMPPLVGWLLAAMNGVAAHGPSFPFLMRVPASVADVATTLLVFELVRRQRSRIEAAIAALVVALSPVLFIISGFHGNTDPVIVMFILLSGYLLASDRPPFWAGAAAAAAISIKLVPVVAIPALAAALIRDRRRLLLAGVGFAAVFVPLWGPVIVRQWSGFKWNVLEYTSTAPQNTRWGIVDFVRQMHNANLLDAIAGPQRFIALAVSALVPAYLVLRRRDAVATGVALSLALFLLLTPAFGTQYLAWAAAAVMLLDVWAGAVYNLIAGIFLAVTYTHWTNGFPWNHVIATQLTVGQERLGWLTWAVLLVCVALGIRRLWRWPVTLPAADLTSTVAREPNPVIELSDERTSARVVQPRASLSERSRSATL